MINNVKSWRLRVAALASSLWLLPITVMAQPAPSLSDKLKQPLKGSELPSTPTGGVEVILGQLTNTFLSVFGIIFLSLMLYGGYKWMIAQGREKEVETAKSMIQSAMIGLGITMLSYAIARFVVNRFIGTIAG